MKENGFVTITTHNHYQRVIRRAGKFRLVPDQELRALSLMRRKFGEKMTLRLARG